MNTIGRRPPLLPAIGRSALLLVLSILFLIYILGPVYWVFASSMMSEADIVAKPTQWIPEKPTLANFQGIFFYDDERVTYETRRVADPATGAFIPSAAQNLLPSLYNSLYVGLWVAGLNILLSLTAGYAIARIHFRGRRPALYAILVTRVIPDVALVVPLFLVIRHLGLIDTRESLILTYLAVTVPFTVFILINYFESIPADLDRAARVDGCSHWQVLYHVFLPLGMPAIVASLMFAFLTSWNEFILALILTQTIGAQTLPIVISGFVFDFTTSFSFVNAAGVVAIVPPVLLAVLFERYIVGGLTAGAVKG
jgi:multiple sugar transport system permease protein